MRPEDVTTSGVQVLEVIRSTGDGGWSIARLRKGHETYVGFRWNGLGDAKGYPTSRGYPVWCALPNEVAATLETHYKADFRLAYAGCPPEWLVKPEDLVEGYRPGVLADKKV